MRKCTRCHKSKPLDCFAKPDGGLFKLCKTCRKYTKHWQDTHPESRKETCRKYTKSDKGKACAKRYGQTEKGRKSRRQRAAKYQATEKGKTAKRRARKKYYASEKGKSTIRAYQQGPGRKNYRNYREKYPQRTRARQAVNNAVEKGYIEKPLACEICGQVDKLHGHHYAGWEEEHKLNVWWLCNSCDRLDILPHDGSLTLDKARELIIPILED